MGVLVYFEFWVELVLVWKKILVKMAKNWSFLFCPTYTPMPRHRSPCLGGFETGFLAFFGPPRRSLGIPVSFVSVTLFRKTYKCLNNTIIQMHVEMIRKYHI